MATINPDPRRDVGVYDTGTPYSGAVTASGPSAVSWAAIFAGAAAAAVLSFVLLLLGTGLGLSSLSPWANEGGSPRRTRRLHSR